MRYIFKALLLVTSLSWLSANAVVAGESVVVIVNKQNQQALTKQDIKNIYADIVTEWDNGKRINVMNLPVDSSARENFSQKLFGESAQRMAAAESNRKITNTIKNPSRTKSERLVAILVGRNPDAIGYIPRSMLDKVDNVRVVLQID
jgi:ABC-type phosphate transport system substrate-binding protein